MTTANNDSTEGYTADIDQAPERSTTGYTFTVREAAAACDVHPNTVRRAIKGNKFPNAYTDAAGTWRLPVADLEAAGFRPHRAGPTVPASVEKVTTANSVATGAAVDRVHELEAEAVRLRVEMAELARRADVAEALAAERAERVEDLRLALRALEAVNPSPEDRARAPQSPVEAPSPTPRPRTPARRRSWLDRLLR